jgi:hypothetical protein
VLAPRGHPKQDHVQELVECHAQPTLLAQGQHRGSRELVLEQAVPELLAVRVLAVRVLAVRVRVAPALALAGAAVQQPAQLGQPR